MSSPTAIPASPSPCQESMAACIEFVCGAVSGRPKPKAIDQAARWETAEDLKDAARRFLIRSPYAASLGLPTGTIPQPQEMTHFTGHFRYNHVWNNRSHYCDDIDPTAPAPEPVIVFEEAPNEVPDALKRISEPKPHWLPLLVAGTGLAAKRALPWINRSAKLISAFVLADPIPGDELALLVTLPLWLLTEVATPDPMPEF